MKDEKENCLLSVAQFGQILKVAFVGLVEWINEERIVLQAAQVPRLVPGRQIFQYVLRDAFVVRWNDLDWNKIFS